MLVNTTLKLKKDSIGNQGILQMNSIFPPQSFTLNVRA